MARPSASRAILIGGLIAGAFDITFAFIFYSLRGSTPLRILQSIASGLLGASAFRGGMKTAILGFFLHFFIATSAATIFYLVSRKLKFMIEYAIICGILYGLCVYVVMNFVVLPLSAIPFKPSHAASVVIAGLLIHMFGIGLPISLAVRRYSN